MDDLWSLVRDAVRGGIAGGVATWFMDQFTTGMVKSESEAIAAAESAARPHGQTAIANLVEQLDRRLGLDLDVDGKNAAGSVIHYGLGVAPGAAYGVVAPRLPVVALGSGLAFGIAVWLVNDEYLNARLGLAAEWGQYPIQTHWRGLVGHAVLGVATHVGFSLLAGRVPGDRPSEGPCC